MNKHEGSKSDLHRSPRSINSLKRMRLGGIEQWIRIRGNDTTKAIPIIMVTTRGEAESVESGFKSGCDDYVTKPINGLEVLSKVKSALGE